MGEHWRDRAPAMLHKDREATCYDDHPDPTGPDRRWLWRLESFLAINGTTKLQMQMQRDLRQYLNESCEHHWHDYDGEDKIAVHRQCIYCHDVIWATEDGDG